MLKDLGPQSIASMRKIITGFRTIGLLFGKLYSALGALALQGVGVAFFHDREFQDQDVDTRRSPERVSRLILRISCRISLDTGGRLG